MGEIRDGMYGGHIECGLCDHVERFFHPVAGLMEMQDHLENEHGVTEDELVEAMEVQK